MHFFRGFIVLNHSRGVALIEGRRLNPTTGKVSPAPMSNTLCSNHLKNSKKIGFDSRLMCLYLIHLPSIPNSKYISSVLMVVFISWLFKSCNFSWSTFPMGWKTHGFFLREKPGPL